MHKKLGPLETWQWLAIGAAAGILYYLYQRRQAAAATASSTGATSPTASTSDLGPIDPTTGQPFASEGAAAQDGGTAQNGGQTSLAQELSDLTAIEGLLSGLQNIQPVGPTGQPLPGTKSGWMIPGSVTKQIQKLQDQIADQAKKAAAAARDAAADRKHNPGHTVKTHAGGKQSASSSAPHSSLNQSNVAPPTHQRHPPTKHPSNPMALHPHLTAPPPPKNENPQKPPKPPKHAVHGGPVHRTF